ncbi:putative nuclease HARBI1 [Hydra vulgaris]|uniref:Nuclease HARBI1 n=1 Tax=Hydra vulgaris TaxID=6087 RepID=A0ABM4BQ28_HYDVU
MAPTNNNIYKFIASLISCLISALGNIATVTTLVLTHLLSLNRNQVQLISLMNMDLQKISKRHQKNIKRRVKKRRNWENPGRSDIWWRNLESGYLLTEEWILNLRMDYNVFMKLVDSIRHHISLSPRFVRRDTFSPERRVAMVLYYLKDKGSFRMVANTFGVSKATLSVSLRLVCCAINLELGPKLIKFPNTNEEINFMTYKFESKFGIPLVLGCFDGTHIPIQQPQDNCHDYFCYKMKYSLNCQAVGDEKGRFTDVEIRWPGSVHDARIYANKLVPGYSPVLPFLLEDPAYPLLPNLLKEYPHSESDKHALFNNMLRSARNQIECAFGRLKSRWRVLNRCIDVDLELTTPLVYTCFVLHNFCEDNEVVIHSELIQAKIVAEKRSQCCDHHNKLDKLYTYNLSRGVQTREAVAQYCDKYLK